MPESDALPEAATPACPWHPERPVSRACVRCGTLVCPQCAASGPPDEPVCPPCAAHHRFRTLRREGGVVDPIRCVEVAWAVFRQNWSVIVVTTVLMVVLQLVAGIPAGAVQLTSQFLDTGERFRAPLFGLWLLLEVAAYYVSFSLHLGLVMVWLRLLRGQPADPLQVFHGFRSGHLVLLAFVPYLLAVLAGALALLVGAVVVALGFSLFIPLIADKGMAPMESLRASWQLTRGSRWSLFLVAVLGLPIAMLGMLACCVGVIPAYGIIIGTQVVAYSALTWPGNHYLND